MCSLITVVSGNDQGDGSAVAVLESMGSKGSVLVNGTHVKKNTSCVLNSGDEVVFGVLGNHSYVSFSFVQLNVLFSFSNEKYQLYNLSIIICFIFLKVFYFKRIFMWVIFLN